MLSMLRTLRMLHTQCVCYAQNQYNIKSTSFDEFRAFNIKHKNRCERKKETSHSRFLGPQDMMFILETSVRTSTF